MDFASIEIMEEWMKFRRQVTEIHPNFFSNLAQHHPDLTDRDVKYCALFLFECSIREIAARMGNITIDAVRQAKYRLKLKFGLPKGGLSAYLQRIASGIIPPPPHLQTQT